MGIACSLFVTYRLDVNQISKGVTWYYLDIQLHNKKVIDTKSQCYTTSPCACISMMPRSDKHIWLELNTKRSPLVLCRYTASQEDRQKGLPIQFDYSMLQAIQFDNYMVQAIQFDNSMVQAIQFDNSVMQE